MPAVISRHHESDAERRCALPPLLQLPAELRNQIYSYVLGGKSIILRTLPPSYPADSQDYIHWEDVTQCEESDEDELPVHHFRRPPGSIAGGIIPHLVSCDDDEECDTLHILSVCSQIYFEARDLIWSLNRFRYGDISDLGISDLEIWKQERAGALELIEHTALYTQGESDQREWCNGLKYFPSLKKVDVVVCVVYFGPDHVYRVGNAKAVTVDEWKAEMEVNIKNASNAWVEVIFYQL
jgi:hypothetical protein